MRQHTNVDRIIIVALISIMHCFSIYAYGAEVNEIPKSRANWIWYPENAVTDAVKQNRFFRKEINLETAPLTGTVTITADDEYELYVNGVKATVTRLLSNRVNGWQNPKTHDIASVLKPGKNILSIIGKNGSSYAGILLRGSIQCDGSKTVSFYSDRSWKVAKSAGAEWMSPSFNDSGWISAKELGGIDCKPWSGIGFDFHPFLDADEQNIPAIYNKFQENLIDLSKLNLESEVFPNTSVVYQNGRPFIQVNNRVLPPFIYILQSDPFEKFEERQVRNFTEKAGVKLLMTTVSLKYVWSEDGSIDFQMIDRTLKKLIELNPTGYVLLSVGIEMPRWWVSQNPDELVGYATGAPEGYSIARGRDLTPSIASKKWRNDAASCLRKIISHIGEQQWGKRIIGYRFCYGVHGEWHYPGMRKDMPDTGKAMTMHFRDWLQTKYENNIALLRKAWVNPTIDFSTATVPGESERNPASGLSLRIPSKDQRIIDYYTCLHEMTADAVIGFAKVVHAASKNRVLAGTYFGYFFGMPYPCEGFHLDFQRVLESTDVDFLSAPYDYDPRSRKLGGDGLSRSMPALFEKHNKLHIMEDDTFTHLAGYSSHRWAKDNAQSVGILLRQLSGAICMGYGIQWIEFSFDKRQKGWFDTPEILDSIRKGIEIYASNEIPGREISPEVCVILSPENIKYFGYPVEPNALSDNLLSGVVHELSKCSVPFEVITPAELEQAKYANCRLYIFLNCFYLSDHQRRTIETVVKQQGKTAVWMFASGGITPEGLSDEAIDNLTGIQIQHGNKKALQAISLLTDKMPYTKVLSAQEDNFPEKPMKDGPCFFVTDRQAHIMGVNKETGQPSLVLKQQNGWNSIYCGVPFISSRILGECIKISGANRYLETGEIVYGDGRIIAIHSGTGGIREIKLPHKSSQVIDMFSQKPVEKDVSSFSVTFQPGETKLFNIE